MTYLCIAYDSREYPRWCSRDDMSGDFKLSATLRGHEADVREHVIPSSSISQQHAFPLQLFHVSRLVDARFERLTLVGPRHCLPEPATALPVSYTHLTLPTIYSV